MSTIRTKESTTKEVYVNVNDLIIDLHLELKHAQNDSERVSILRIITKLTEIRDSARTQ